MVLSKGQALGLIPEILPTQEAEIRIVIPRYLKS
jgi:hypothetical protein